MLYNKMDNDQKNQKAKLILEECMKEEGIRKVTSLYLMLVGKGKWKIESFRDAGHDYDVVMNEIYEYYRKNPTSELEELYYQALDRAVRGIMDLSDVGIVFNYLDKELSNEKKGISPFKLDMQSLLNKFANALVKMKEYGIQEQYIREKDQYFSENYGMHF